MGLLAPVLLEKPVARAAVANGVSVALAEEGEEVRLAKRRDEATWATWYDRYRPILHRYALARLTNVQEAEDVASQTFLKALQSIDGYRYRGKPVLAWLYRIAHNLIADRERQAPRTSRLYETGDSAAPSTADRADGILTSVDLQSALAGLNVDQREIIILRYALGFSTPDLVALTGKNEAAIYSLQARAIRRLRERLR